MLQLGFLIVMENRCHNLRSKHERYFLLMLIITLLSFVADIMSSLYAGPAWFFPFAAAGNYLEIALNTILLPIFYHYVCEQIFNLDLILKRRLNIILWVLVAVCIALAVSTAYTGQIFYFDSNNLYHRGPLFWFPMFVLFVMMAIIEVFLISQRKKIEASHFRSLALFIVSPLIGWAFQLLIFGLPFSLMGITFAALIVFTNIQNHHMDVDYLTGAFNRQMLDGYMQHKINMSNGHRTFSALLLDIDNFKSINDCFGHYEGDTALIRTVAILRNSIKPKDLIARYGGDEFCVILESDNSKDIEDTLDKIHINLTEFNRNNNKPYELCFSIGYAIYDLSMGKKAELFLKVIDEKMYHEKNAHKAKNDIENM